MKTIVEEGGVYLSPKEVIALKNKLTQVTLSADRIASEKIEIYKTVEEIKEILKDKRDGNHL